jgi:hypothetical protein
VGFDLLETIKTIGGLSGLASATFLIIDRMFRFSPTISFRPDDNVVKLVIRNWMTESLIVDDIAITPPYLGIPSRDDLGSTLTIIQAAVEARAKSGVHTSPAFLVVNPLAEQMYPLVRLISFDDLSADTKIKIRCRWRSTGRSFFLKRRAKASTTVGDVLRMLKALGG